MTPPLLTCTLCLALFWLQDGSSRPIVTEASATEVAEAAVEPPAEGGAEFAEALDHERLLARMDELAALSGGSARRVTLGASRGGRELALLEIAAPQLPAGSPALLIAAGLEGPRAFDSALALDHARRLIEGRGSDAAVDALLGGWRVLVLPRLALDEAEARFATPSLALAGVSGARDDDRDGRLDEDGPADIDGDGLVLEMRVPDPAGEWLADPHDPRATIEADVPAGLRGAFLRVPEGRDLDGDGSAAEDPPGGTRPNANFPAGWAEHSSAAGDFPAVLPEVRALCDFVIARPDIALVLSYDGLDELVELPSGVDAGGRPPNPGYLKPDREVLEPLAERYAELTGGDARNEGERAGSLQAWAYEHRGLWTLNANPWSLPRGAPEAEATEDEATEDEATEDEDATEEQQEPEQAPEESVQDETAAEPETPELPGKPGTGAEELAWIDALPAEAWRFRDWQPFEHPELGPVEIGGFTPFARVDPPAEARAEIAAAQFDFLCGLAELPARLEIERFWARDLGAGVLRLEARVTNVGRLPSQSAAMARARTAAPTPLELRLPEAAELLAGRARHLLGAVGGSGGGVEFEWLVRGAPSLDAISLELTSAQCGTNQATPVPSPR